MTATDRVEDDAEAQLFDVLGDRHAGMLAIDSAGLTPRPMSPHPERAARAIWFVVPPEGDLVRAVGLGTTAQFTVTGGDHDYWACLSGPVEQSADKRMLADLWTEITSAWIESDPPPPPAAALLKMTIRDAQVWTAARSPLVFGLSAIRARLDDERRAEIGRHRRIRL